jgi:hypothetical protein
MKHYKKLLYIVIPALLSSPVFVFQNWLIEKTSKREYREALIHIMEAGVLLLLYLSSWFISYYLKHRNKTIPPGVYGKSEPW